MMKKLKKLVIMLLVVVMLVGLYNPTVQASPSYMAGVDAVVAAIAMSAAQSGAQCYDGYFSSDGTRWVLLIDENRAREFHLTMGNDSSAESVNMSIINYTDGKAVSSNSEAMSYFGICGPEDTANFNNAVSGGKVLYCYGVGGTCFTTWGDFLQNGLHFDEGNPVDMLIAYPDGSVSISNIYGASPYCYRPM